MTKPQQPTHQNVFIAHQAYAVPYGWDERQISDHLGRTDWDYSTNGGKFLETVDFEVYQFQSWYYWRGLGAFCRWYSGEFPGSGFDSAGAARSDAQTELRAIAQRGDCDTQENL